MDQHLFESNHDFKSERLQWPAITAAVSHKTIVNPKTKSTIPNRNIITDSPYENLRQVHSQSALPIPIRMAQQSPDLTYCSLMAAAKPMQDKAMMCGYGYAGDDA